MEIKVEELKSGDAIAYKALVFNGILDLVTESTAPIVTVPETLSLDALRLKALRVHFHTDAACAVIIITVSDELGPHVTSKATREEIVDSVAGIVISTPPRLNIAPHTTKLVLQHLEREAGLGPDHVQRIKGLVETNLAEESPMYKRIVNLFKVHWGEAMWQGNSQRIQESGVLPASASSLIKVGGLFCFE